MSIFTSFFGNEEKIHEAQVYLTSPKQIEEKTYILNKESLGEVEAQAMPYYRFAKLNRCYVIDSKGDKSYPAITEKVFNNEKMLKKDWIMLYATLNNPENFTIPYGCMDTKEKELFQYVLCHHYVSEEQASEILDRKNITEKTFYYWIGKREPVGSLKQWYRVIMANSPHVKFDKGYYLELKDDIYAKFLHLFNKDLVNVPIRKDLSEEEKKGLTLYSGENEIFMLMPILNSLHDSKQIPLGRNRVSTAAVKKAAGKLNIREFFPNKVDDSSLLAATFLINSYSIYHNSHTKSNKNKVETQEILRDLIEDNNYDNNFLIPILLPQITGFRKTTLENSMGINFMGDILGTFIELQNRGWIDINQFCFHVRTFSEQSEENFMIFYIYDLNKIELFNQYDKKDIYLDNFYHEVTIPLIKAYIFMMATLGLVEIAYSNETNDDKDAASYFDGLKYVRLTDLGRYALSITDKYVRTKGEDIAYFELDAENLIIKSLTDTNPYESLLGDFSERISRKMYRVTPESFLKNCNNKKDLESKIALFKDYVCDNPPANWNAFFNQMLDRCNPITKPKNRYVLMQLPADNKELQRIVLSDPNIRQYTLKAEDYHILVEQDNLKKFCDTLKKYGYLI